MKNTGSFPVPMTIDLLAAELGRIDYSKGPIRAYVAMRYALDREDSGWLTIVVHRNGRLEYFCEVGAFDCIAGSRIDAATFPFQLNPGLKTTVYPDNLPGGDSQPADVCTAAIQVYDDLVGKLKGLPGNNLAYHSEPGNTGVSGRSASQQPDSGHDFIRDTFRWLRERGANI